MSFVHSAMTPLSNTSRDNSLRPITILQRNLALALPNEPYVFLQAMKKYQSQVNDELTIS